MNKFDLSFLKTALPNATFGDDVKDAGWVCTDSRKVDDAALFVALHGERFDAHKFIDEELCARAAGVVVHNDVDGGAAKCINVDNTERALQDIAHAHLMRMPAKRIALTGSNGKTTTKELIAAILVHASSAAAMTATKGNLNNHIGVPLTAFDVDKQHQFAVIEMGMNHLGEIRRLAEIAVPDVGLITNIGTAHAGNVGGPAGVAKAKGELFAAMAGTDGICVACADDDVMMGLVPDDRRSTLVTFGRSSEATVCLKDASGAPAGGQHMHFVVDGDDLQVTFALEGAHNAMNAAAAVAACIAAGVDAALAVEGLAQVEVPPGRLQRKTTSTGGVLLDDSYNANPDSMRAGLAVLLELDGDAPRAAALGDMLELGDEGPSAHVAMGEHCAALQLEQLFVCGSLGAHIAKGALSAGMPDDAVFWAEDSAALAVVVQEQAAAGAGWLVKGSRGARMERVVDVLVEKGEL